METDNDYEHASFFVKMLELLPEVSDLERNPSRFASKVRRRRSVTRHFCNQVATHLPL